MKRSRRKRTRRPPLHGNRSYDDNVSRQYDRSRIERELNDFYSYTRNPGRQDIISFPDEGCGEDIRGWEAGRAISNDNTDGLDHLNDPDFNPVRDRCDSDSVDFLIDQNDKLHAEQEEHKRTNLLESHLIHNHDPQQSSSLEVPSSAQTSMSAQITDADNPTKGKEKISFNSIYERCFQEEEPNTTLNETPSATPIPIASTLDRGDNLELPKTDENKSQQQDESVIEGFSIIQRQQSFSPSKKTPFFSYNKEEPPGLLMINTSLSSSTGDDKTMYSCRSQVSYDETTITPSISFFLTANKQELQNEGLSVAGSHHHVPSISPNHHSSFFSSFNTFEDVDDTETAKGYSRGSSKFTTDSPRILELREKKRLIERSHERKFAKFPALIELDRHL